jgi:dTMP kinase
MRSNHLAYAFAATASLSLGLGFSFWQSAAENGLLQRANLTASIALEAAQDETKLLREKLDREIKERRQAEAAQTIAETAERTARERLAQETKARQTAEIARAGAEEGLRVSTAKLAQEEEAHQAAEMQLEAVVLKLEEERKAGLPAEMARKNAENAVSLLRAKLTEEIRAMKSAEAALSAAEVQARALTKIITGNGNHGAEAKLCYAMPRTQNGLEGTAESQKGATPSAEGSLSEEAVLGVRSTETATVPAAHEGSMSRPSDSWKPALTIQ